MLWRRWFIARNFKCSANRRRHSIMSPSVSGTYILLSLIYKQFNQKTMPEEKKESLIKVFIRRVFIFLKFLFAGIKLFFSNPFWKNKLLSNLIFISLVLNGSLWIYFFQNKKESAYPAILHYNIIFGIDYLDEYGKIYLISSAGLIIIFANAILGYILYNKEKLATYFLVFNMLIVQIFLIVAGYLIVGINL